MNRYIWITTQFEGFHYWLEAPDEVKYLRDNHRHIFNIKISISVEHNDREIEFHMFKKEINNYLKDWPKNLKGTSCEMMAEQINEFINTKYNGRKVRIEVDEDKENGVTLEYNNQNI